MLKKHRLVKLLSEMRRLVYKYDMNYREKLRAASLLQQMGWVSWRTNSYDGDSEELGDVPKIVSSNPPVSFFLPLLPPMHNPQKEILC
jgi:hypothetical protein